MVPRIKKAGLIMKIIESNLKEMIAQALNNWACQLENDVKNLSNEIKNGVEIPPNLYGLIKENAQRVRECSDDWENFCDSNIISLNENEFDKIIDFFN